MELWKSIPFALILLPLALAALTSILKDKQAQRLSVFVLGLLTALAAVFTVLMIRYDGSYTYRMGHYSAPWGNEIRAGVTEAVTALCFLAVMLFSFLGGLHKQRADIRTGKQNLYCVLIMLMTSALMAEVFTNDMFTAYVFIEIMTISAAALIASRTKGHTLVASVRYMILNMVGSGLFLLGIVMLYDISGHLLMENIRKTLSETAAAPGYDDTLLTLVIALITVGLCIKSALFPFHTWVADAYSYSTPTSSAVLSSLVSKAYIFLLIKTYARVIGFDLIASTGVGDLLFICGVVGMIMGSVLAIRQTEIRRMIALSSVAQIGYIYMGIGLGSEAGLTAALFHVFAHAVCKSMLFISSSDLIERSNDSKAFHMLRGAGYRSPLTGIAFTVGSLSMIGIPFLGGFASKLNFAVAALETGTGARMIAAFAALTVSTFLNTMYFLRTVITLYRRPHDDVIYETGNAAIAGRYGLSLVMFVLLTVAMGIFSYYIVRIISAGWAFFA